MFTLAAASVCANKNEHTKKEAKQKTRQKKRTLEVVHFEHGLEHLGLVLARVQRRLGQQNFVVFRVDLHSLEECVVVQVLHARPVLRALANNNEMRTKMKEERAHLHNTVLHGIRGFQHCTENQAMNKENTTQRARSVQRQTRTQQQHTPVFCALIADHDVLELHVFELFFVSHEWSARQQRNT